MSFSGKKKERSKESKAIDQSKIDSKTSLCAHARMNAGATMNFSLWLTSLFKSSIVPMFVLISAVNSLQFCSSASNFSRKFS